PDRGRKRRPTKNGELFAQPVAAFPARLFHRIGQYTPAAVPLDDRSVDSRVQLFDPTPATFGHAVKRSSGSPLGGELALPRESGNGLAHGRFRNAKRAHQPD